MNATNAPEVRLELQQGPRHDAADRVVWIGAISFEARCTGSLTALVRGGCTLSQVVTLEYPTRVDQVDEDADLRDEHRERVRALSEGEGAAGFQNSVTIEPYAYHDFFRKMAELLTEAADAHVVLDVSCLTKVHAIALAALLVRREMVPGSLTLAYTIPENYNVGGDANFAWAGSVVAPLLNGGDFTNEPHARGLVIAGHEAHRLLVGLMEVEPRSGSFVIGEMVGRPDMWLLSERRHRRIVRHLRALRHASWEVVTVRVTDMEHLEAVAIEEIGAARKHKAPLVLFPYGPKPLVVSAAATLAQFYPEGSWFVYPVPVAYDVAYSEGIGETMWFSVR